MHTYVIAGWAEVQKHENEFGSRLKASLHLTFKTKVFIHLELLGFK